MAKPDYIADSERSRRIEDKAPKCRHCKYFGKPSGKSRDKAGKVIEVFRCVAHPKCVNTWNSLGCDDWTPILPDMNR